MGMRLEELTEGELSLVRAAVDLIADEHGWVRSELLDATEAKVERALVALDEAIYMLDPDEEDIAKEAGLYRIVTAYKELKGET
jgi:hypothetical protein